MTDKIENLELARKHGAIVDCNMVTFWPEEFTAFSYEFETEVKARALEEAAPFIRVFHPEAAEQLQNMAAELRNQHQEQKEFK